MEVSLAPDDDEADKSVCGGAYGAFERRRFLHRALILPPQARASSILNLLGRSRCTSRTLPLFRSCCWGAGIVPQLSDAAAAAAAAFPSYATTATAATACDAMPPVRHGPCPAASSKHAFLRARKLSDVAHVPVTPMKWVEYMTLRRLDTGRNVSLDKTEPQVRSAI